MAGEVKPGEMVLEPGWVYCFQHGTVHEDSTDPYDMGEPDCQRSEHRPLYWRAGKDDYR